MLTDLDCFLPYCCFSPCFDFLVVYKCHVVFSLNFVLLSSLESVFISSSVLHTAKNPSDLDVIHKFDVYSLPLRKVSHRT